MMKEVIVKKSRLDTEIDTMAGIIEDAYQNEVTIPEAEKLAARALHVQMLIASELAKVELDARMRKNGVKAHRAKVYMEELAKHEKKPAEGFLDNVIALDPACNKEQDAYDAAEVRRNSLDTMLGIMKDFHIFMRGVAKGRFE